MIAEAEDRKSVSRNFIFSSSVKIAGFVILFFFMPFFFFLYSEESFISLEFKTKFPESPQYKFS